MNNLKLNLNPLSYTKPGAFEENRFEKIHNVIFDNSEMASKAIAQEISDLIRLKQKEEKNCVLGLATGSSPIKVYEELIKLHKNEGLSFKNVITFNLDEYYPIENNDYQSYYHFMQENLFKHIDVKPENSFIPRGNIEQNKVNEYCNNYENLIKKVGGIDFQLLGIGRTGHIGFNEPGSHLNSQTRIITLDHITRLDAAPAFQNLEQVPKNAITMGIDTILKAKRIVLLAWGRNKAEIIKKATEGEISSHIPATYLQLHQNTTIVIDKTASSELVRIREPWIIGNCKWNEVLKREAIIWLCEKLQKPILKLTDKDYNINGISSLLNYKCLAYNLNIEMFNQLQNTITGWPGGKPNSADARRPERALPVKKTVVILSFQYDRAISSMGGTIDRLIEQGHDVHIIYQESDSSSVTNDECLKYVEVFRDIIPKNSEGIIDVAIREINNSKQLGTDSSLIQSIKKLIREKESLGATSYLGISKKNVHFLNMSLGDELGLKEVDLLKEILKEIDPQQIFAAGDFNDPHGFEKKCIDFFKIAFKELQAEMFVKDCWVWLYNASLKEWDISEIDMAVPLSPDQVIKKRNAIFNYISQREEILFQGEDTRKFWIRSEVKNRKTAKKYHKLGLTEYEALEVFKRL
jgi:glucosamine-6-phosphate deaminase